MPPVRDEEHEIQRKAHAKRVRETRRSTQGDYDDVDDDEMLMMMRYWTRNIRWR